MDSVAFDPSLLERVSPSLMCMVCWYLCLVLWAASKQIYGILSPQFSVSHDCVSVCRKCQTISTLGHDQHPPPPAPGSKRASTRPWPSSYDPPAPHSGLASAPWNRVSELCFLIDGGQNGGYFRGPTTICCFLKSSGNYHFDGRHFTLTTGLIAQFNCAFFIGSHTSNMGMLFISRLRWYCFTRVSGKCLMSCCQLCLQPSPPPSPPIILCESWICHFCPLLRLVWKIVWKRVVQKVSVVWSPPLLRS